MDETVVKRSRVKKVSTVASEKSPSEVNLLKKLIKPTPNSNDLLINKKSPLKKAVVLPLKQGQEIEMTSRIIHPEVKKFKKTVSVNEAKTIKPGPSRSLQSHKIPKQVKVETKYEQGKENKPKKNEVKMFEKKKVKKVTFDEASISSSKVLRVQQSEVAEKPEEKKLKTESATETREKKAVSNVKSEAVLSFRTLTPRKIKNQAEEKKFVKEIRFKK